MRRVIVTTATLLFLTAGSCGNPGPKNPTDDPGPADGGETSGKAPAPGETGESKPETK